MNHQLNKQLRKLLQNRSEIKVTNGETSTLEPPSGLEHGTPGLGNQRLNHSVIFFHKSYNVLMDKNLVDRFGY